MRDRQRTIREFEPAIDGLTWAFPAWLAALRAVGYRVDRLAEPARSNVVLALRARAIHLGAGAELR